MAIANRINDDTIKVEQLSYYCGGCLKPGCRLKYDYGIAISDATLPHPLCKGAGGIE